MKCPWQNSDASYDARTTMSDRFNDHLNEFEDKSIIYLDNDYLNFHRLIMGQPAKHKPRSINERYSIKQQIDRLFMDPCSLDDGDDLIGAESFSDAREGQQSETGAVSDLQRDDDDENEIQEKSNRPDLEMDREYAIFVANSRALECDLTGNDLLYDRSNKEGNDIGKDDDHRTQEKSDINVERNQDSSHLFARPRPLEDGAKGGEILFNMVNEKNDVAVQDLSCHATVIEDAEKIRDDEYSHDILDDFEDEEDYQDALFNYNDQQSQRQYLSDVFGDKEAAQWRVRKMNARPRGCTIQQCTVQIASRKKMVDEAGKGKNVVVKSYKEAESSSMLSKRAFSKKTTLKLGNETTKGSKKKFSGAKKNLIERNKNKFLEADEGKSLVRMESGTKRKFSEANNGKNVVHEENEIEQVERALREVKREEKEIQMQAVLERYKRNFDVVRRIKKRVVELESSMKEKFEDLMALQDFEILDQKNISRDGSADLQAVINDVAGNSNSINSTDARCVMPAEICRDNIKIEQSFYVTDHSDVEVLDNAAVAEQRIPSSLLPSTRHLIITENDPAQAIESASAIEFRRCVMCSLSKPFDMDEYAELWKLFKYGAYRCSNPDVGKKLSEYRYRKEKRLNILRGFFFWLQNVTQEGSFEPWEDSECLAV